MSQPKWNYGGIVEGGSGVEMTTRDEADSIGITELNPYDDD